STCTTLTSASSNGSFHSQCQRLRRRPRPGADDSPSSLFLPGTIPISTIRPHGSMRRLSSRTAPPQRATDPCMTNATIAPDAPHAARDRLSRSLRRPSWVGGVPAPLAETWRRTSSCGSVPPVARALLGEAPLASALFTALVKVDGPLSVQLRGEGALRTLFA